MVGKGASAMTKSEKLYCAMLHLACYTDDAKKQRVANPVSMCERCRISETSGCRWQRFFENVGDIAKSVGVSIGPYINPEAYQVHVDI